MWRKPRTFHSNMNVFLKLVFYGLPCVSSTNAVIYYPLTRDNEIQSLLPVLLTWRRGLQCHSRGKMEPTARGSFSARGIQKSFLHPNCIDSNPGSEFRPRRCTPSDETTPRHPRPDSTCRARPPRSHTVLWTPGASEVSEKSQLSLPSGMSSGEGHKQGSGAQKYMHTPY